MAAVSESDDRQVFEKGDAVAEALQKPRKRQRTGLATHSKAKAKAKAKAAGDDQKDSSMIVAQRTVEPATIDRLDVARNDVPHFVLGKGTSPRTTSDRIRRCRCMCSRTRS